MEHSTHNACECGNINEAEKYRQLDKIMKEYEFKHENLIQILHMAQAVFGYLPIEVQRYISRNCKLPLSKVSGVVTFYSFFSTKQKGEYTIRVCLGTACYVRGGKKLLDKLKDHLGIEVGETTKDLKFTLEVMRCIGACGLAPAITINDKVYKQVVPSKIPKILGKYQ